MRSEPFGAVVTGSEGQLGSELTRLAWPSGIRVTGKRRAELDITNAEEVEAVFAQGGCQMIINAAAYTAVDGAETERDLAFAVNQQGPATLAGACARHGAALIHISTDYVFDGAKPSPYVESDPLAPLGVYGGSKAAGESAIRTALPQHLILRTAWLFGARGRNFVKTVIRLLTERDQLRIVADQKGSPTAAPDLASAIMSITERVATDHKARHDGLWGTYHCANAGEGTWHDLAQQIADLAGPRLGRHVVVQPISSAEYPTPARRPANSRLDCRKLEQAFDLRLRSWRDALAPVVDEILELRNGVAGKEDRR